MAPALSLSFVLFLSALSGSLPLFLLSCFGSVSLSLSLSLPRSLCVGVLGIQVTLYVSAPPAARPTEERPS